METQLSSIRRQSQSCHRQPFRQVYRSWLRPSSRFFNGWFDRYFENREGYHWEENQNFPCMVRLLQRHIANSGSFMYPTHQHQPHRNLVADIDDQICKQDHYKLCQLVFHVELQFWILGIGRTRCYKWNGMKYFIQYYVQATEIIQSQTVSLHHSLKNQSGLEPLADISYSANIHTPQTIS